jgi:hypothetical protein
METEEKTTEKKVTTPLTLSTGQFQLQANLESILAGAALGGYLRITLCGYGPVIPFSNPGPAGMLADAGVPQIVGPQSGGPLLVVLYCNNFITPAGTFYEVAILDANKNVIQAGNYVFNTTGVTLDLTQATQILPPYGFYLPSLKFAACTGTVPGTVYTAAGQTVLAVAYNGIFLRSGQTAPLLSYSTAGNIITLNFTTQIGDRVDALCI